MLALGRQGERRQGREAGMLVVVAENRRGPHGRPGAAPGGPEQQAALSQEGEVGPKSSGFF
jgi:hypothetical protein